MVYASVEYSTIVYTKTTNEIKRAATLRETALYLRNHGVYTFNASDIVAMLRSQSYIVTSSEVFASLSYDGGKYTGPERICQYWTLQRNAGTETYEWLQWEHNPFEEVPGLMTRRIYPGTREEKRRRIDEISAIVNPFHKPAQAVAPVEEHRLLIEGISLAIDTGEGGILQTFRRLYSRIRHLPAHFKSRSKEMTGGGSIAISPRLRYSDSEYSLDGLPKLLEPTHELIKVTTRKGYVYACASAIGDAPLTLDEAEAIWNDKYERNKNFMKYDESTGHFIK